MEGNRAGVAVGDRGLQAFAADEEQKSREARAFRLTRNEFQIGFAREVEWHVRYVPLNRHPLRSIPGPRMAKKP